MKKPVAILAGLMTVLTAAAGVADTTKTSSVDKEEVKLQRTESKEGPRELFEEAQNNLLNHSLNINTNMDQASDKYNRIIDNYPNTDYSKIAKFMNISILYSDCSSGSVILSKYIKILEEVQKFLEKAGYDRYRKDEKFENIEKLLKSVKQEIEKCGSDISKKGSKLEKSIEEFEEEKGNTAFFIEEYESFCNRLKIRYIQRDPEEKIKIDYVLHEISIENKYVLKESYFLQALREIQSVIIPKNSFYHISQLLFNIKIGEIFSAIASAEKSLQDESFSIDRIFYPISDGYFKKEFAKERYREALELTDKIESIKLHGPSELSSIRSNIMSVMEQLEK